jgi:hypothetical protein
MKIIVRINPSAAIKGPEKKERDESFPLKEMPAARISRKNRKYQLFRMGTM